jgi:hypothetical protein
MYDVSNRVTVDVKWRVLEFSHLQSSVVKCWGLPQQENFLANRSQVDGGLPSSMLRLPGNHAVRSGLWQSTLKFRLLTVAFRVTVILFVASAAHI